MRPDAIDGRALLHWIELVLPEPPWPGGAPFLGFVYLDPQAGLSAKGGSSAAVGDADPIARPTLTVRLPIGAPGRVLEAAEVAERKLPARPSWLEHYGPQPPADAAWRSDAALRGRFHRQFPDDLEVLVHDGDPRRTGRKLEKCWVRVVGVEERGGLRVYAGDLLNQPHQLTGVRQGDRLRFVGDPGGRYPLMVTEAYLAERPAWIVEPCGECGLHETLEPMSMMIELRFPDRAAGDAMAMFTSHCPLCKGTQVVRRAEAAP